jgi:hypothetical protein
VQGQTGEVTENPDGSIDLSFGPEAPAGHESNWTQTVPGKGWFSLLREDLGLLGLELGVGEHAL